MTIRRRSKRGTFLWFLPMICVLILFYLYPTLEVIRLSFTNSTLLSPNYKYTLQTYRQMIYDPDILNTFRITFKFVFINVVAQLVLGLTIALAVSYGIKRRMLSAVIARTVVLLSWVIPGIVIGVIWKLLLNEGSYGIINYFVERAGLGKIPFLSLPKYAFISITVANIWRNTGFSMIMQYTGLQSIPEELYEAASIDGAGSVARFWYITLPSLKSIIFINLLFITIFSFNAFDAILALTGGGPGKATELFTISIYNRIFRFMNLGRGCSIAFMLLMVNILISIIYYLVIRIRETED